MNAKQLEAIQARADKTSRAKYVSPNEGVHAVGDRLALLAEVERLYRSNERMDAQILEIRKLTDHLEDEYGQVLDGYAVKAALRKIVGPR